MATESKSTSAISLVLGLSNKYRRVPHKDSEIFGIWHSSKFLVMAATPPVSMNLWLFNTPKAINFDSMVFILVWVDFQLPNSHKVARHIRNILSLSSIPLLAKEIKHLAKHSLKLDGDKRRTFLISFIASNLSASFLRDKSRHLQIIIKLKYIIFEWMGIPTLRLNMVKINYWKQWCHFHYTQYVLWLSIQQNEYEV